jgi:hypothetical protein
MRGSIWLHNTSTCLSDVYEYNHHHHNNNNNNKNNNKNLRYNTSRDDIVGEQTDPGHRLDNRRVGSNGELGRNGGAHTGGIGIRRRSLLLSKVFVLSVDEIIGTQEKKTQRTTSLRVTSSTFLPANSVFFSNERYPKSDNALILSHQP